MSIDSTRATMLRYLNGQQQELCCVLADDVVFTIMATGRRHYGHSAVLHLVDQFYFVTFHAVAEVKIALFGENSAMIEADYIGRQVSAVEGVVATGKAVRLPLCVVYELENDRIRSGRVYAALPAPR